MLMTIIFIVSFMSMAASVFQILALGVFGHNITLPHIFGLSLTNPLFSYPSIGYQIFFWFSHFGVL